MNFRQRNELFLEFQFRPIFDKKSKTTDKLKKVWPVRGSNPRHSRY